MILRDLRNSRCGVEGLIMCNGDCYFRENERVAILIKRSCRGL